MPYNKADIEQTISEAGRLARADGRLRFIYATPTGFSISLKDPKYTDQDYICIGADSCAKISGGVWDKKTINRPD